MREVSEQKAAAYVVAQAAPLNGLPDVTPPPQNRFNDSR